MEFVILGLLTLRSMTIYELNKAFARSVSLFYCASFGSLNAAIAKMVRQGWVIGAEQVENGRNKKIFHLTPAGKLAFQDWLQSEIEAEKVKDQALTRLYFMGLASPAERARVLEKHIENMRRTLDGLETIYRQSAEIETPPGLEEVRRFQLLTLDYGRAFYTFNLAWYQNLLVSLKTEA